MKNKIALSFMAVILGLIIYSCRKEFKGPEDTNAGNVGELSVKDARAYFKSRLRTKSGSTSSASANELRPLWHKAKEGSTDQNAFVEVPLQNPGLSFTLVAFDNNGTPIQGDKSVVKYVFKRLILYKNPKTGTIAPRVLTYIPDRDYLEKNKFDATGVRIKALKGFSGYIQVHTLENEPISVYKYRNGSKIFKINWYTGNTSKSSTSPEIKTKGYEIICTPTYCWQCVTVEDHPEYGETCSEPYECGQNCNNYWVPDPPTDPTNPTQPGENENPGGTTPGGGTGQRTVTISSDARPCVSAISAIIESKAGQMFSCIGDIAGMTNVLSSVAIGNLYASSTYNITIGEAAIPSTTTTDANGNDVTTIVNGKTSPITGNITLNSNVLANATDLAVAGTMIHELMHSYFIYGIKHTTGSEKAFFQEMNQYLYDDNGFPITEQYEVAQHEQMAATYVNSMASLLLSYAHERGIFTSPDSSISLQTYCQDIMWRNLAISQSRITPPNATRAKANGDREANNQFGTNKKGC